MKKLLFLIFSILLSVTIFSQDIKRYKFESGQIEYDHSGSIKGTSVLIWDEFGKKELSVTDTEVKMFGISEKKKEYKLMVGDYLYVWEEGSDEGSKTLNPLAEALKENPNVDFEEFQDKLLENMGYKKTGSETVLGKNCDIWQGLGKMWVWNLLPLKVDVSTLGIESVQVATKVDTDITINSSKFEIPGNINFIDSETMMKNIPTSDDDSEQTEQMKKMMQGLFGSGDD